MKFLGDIGPSREMSQFKINKLVQLCLNIMPKRACGTIYLHRISHDSCNKGKKLGERRGASSYLMEYISVCNIFWNYIQCGIYITPSQLPTYSVVV